MHRKFETGDVVKLNSCKDDKPHMTVKQYADDQVVCSWHNGLMPEQEKYDEDQLTLVRSVRDTPTA